MEGLKLNGIAMGAALFLGGTTTGVKSVDASFNLLTTILFRQQYVVVCCAMQNVVYTVGGADYF